MNFSLKKVTYCFNEDISFYYNIFTSSELTGAMNFFEIFGFVEFFCDFHKFTLHSKDCMLLITTITESSMLLLISYSHTCYLVFTVVMF